MARMRQKADLPSKLCATCGRPFAWRRKWARDWESVRYCSDKCRETKGPSAPDKAGSCGAGTRKP
ncbi:DUF2256 domain-containing protein [uncultured Enterovirga sp.]|uniref:DUF2256 domain-containing protein n=1 Tax=uncultured Enterovirga sp. TaxID=2026352 RepID=UPI0035C9D3B9